MVNGFDIVNPEGWDKFSQWTISRTLSLTLIWIHKLSPFVQNKIVTSLKFRLEQRHESRRNLERNLERNLQKRNLGINDLKLVFTICFSRLWYTVFHKQKP